MFYMSAGVYAKERDISNIVPAISSTIGAIVGYSTRGSLAIKEITNRRQFIEEYGEPTTGNYFHYSALAFLEHGKRLYCRRVINGAIYSGLHVVSSGSGEANQSFATGQVTAVFYDDSGVSDEIFSIVAKDPGVWGSDIGIIIKNIKDNSDSEATEQYTFEIDVYFTDPDGTTGKVENWKVSRKQKLNGYGKQQFLETVINDYSAYIQVYDNSAIADTIVPKANASSVSLAGGTDGGTVTASQIAGADGTTDGWYGFLSPDEIDIRIMIGGGYTSLHSATDIAIIQNAMIAIAESRKDCIAVLDVPLDQTQTNTEITTYRDVTLNANTSYAALYAPYVKINDAYNDMIVEVPPSGYVAGAMAYTDYVAETWYAPAGFNRGVLNCLSLSRIFTEGDRDSLYAENINPLQVFRGEGNVIWGQKTLQAKASSLDRVNVRRLLIVLEKALTISLRAFVFEPNNELTRFRITAMVTEYMDKLSSMGAFQTELGDNGFAVICNETNNTPAVIDANELHVDVFVKPTQAAEFIRLQTIVTTTGTSFEELISRGVLL